MRHFVKSKILLIIVAAVFVLYLSNDFSLLDIKETALIVALGIDKDGDEIEVTAQLAVPKSSDQAANTPGTTVSGKGQTVAQALENIGVRTGWYPKLSFCNVLVLGEGILHGNVMESIDFFIRTVKLQDTARLCAAEKKAKDVLTAASPLDELSAFSLSKILQKDGESSSTVTITSLREFSMGYYSKSAFSMMPLVKIIEEKSGESEGGAKGSDSPTASAKKASSSKEAPQNAQKKQIFDATATLLFSKGVPVCCLNKTQTMILQLSRRKVTEATVELKQTEFDGKSANVFLALRQNRGRLKLRIINGRPTLDLRLRVVAKIDDTDVTTTPSGLVSGYVVPNNILRDAERLISDAYREMFEMTRACDCDVFEIADKLYRTQNRYYAALKDVALQGTRLEIKVVAKSFK
ncbi:MAG: hypothetical protein IKC36_02785 [Clostridia bacterium]|nr:hypothetical protein [Clostridia bacterium]